MGKLTKEEKKLPKSEKRLLRLAKEKAISEAKKADLQQKWLKWSAKYENENLAIADTIYLCNKLARSAKNYLRRLDPYLDTVPKNIEEQLSFLSRFYSLKEKWIKCNQNNVVSAHWVRTEGERELYVYHFSICNKSFSFHSYIKPAVLFNEPGEDRCFYGKVMEDEEINNTLLSELIPMLEFALSKNR